MPVVDRRMFIELMFGLGVGSACQTVHLQAQQSAEQLPSGKYRPGRIENEHPPAQGALLLLGQHQRIRHGPHHTCTMTYFCSYVKLFVRHYTRSLTA